MLIYPLLFFACTIKPKSVIKANEKAPLSKVDSIDYIDIETNFHRMSNGEDCIKDSLLHLLKSVELDTTKYFIKWYDAFYYKINCYKDKSNLPACICNPLNPNLGFLILISKNNNSASVLNVNYDFNAGGTPYYMDFKIDDSGTIYLKEEMVTEGYDEQGRYIETDELVGNHIVKVLLDRILYKRKED